MPPTNPIEVHCGSATRTFLMTESFFHASCSFLAAQEISHYMGSDIVANDHTPLEEVPTALLWRLEF